MESGSTPRAGGSLKTLFLALEGMTGGALREAFESDALPALRNITKGGALSELRFPIADTRIGMLASAMTGGWPDQHGILTAETRDPASGTLRPARESDLAMPTLWEALDGQGVPCLSVGWPLSSGVGTVHASVVTSGFGETPGVGMHPDPALFLHPRTLSERLGWLWLRPEELDPTSLNALAPEWEKIDRSADSRPGLLATTVAGNVSRHAAFLELLGAGGWEFATLCVSLPGELLSLERASTRMGDGLFEGLAGRAMPLINALIGAVLETLPEGTNLIIAGIPHAESPDEAGFLAVGGPAFDPRSFPRALCVTELTPLAWAACGFSVEGSFPGGIAADHSVPGKIPPSCSSSGNDHRSLIGTETDLRHAPERRLDPIETWRFEALSVLARSLMARGCWDRAIPALEAQLRMMPLYQTGYLQLSECRQRLGHMEEALDAAYSAIHPMHGGDPVALLRVAELEALAGRADRARSFLGQALPTLKPFPHRRLLMANVLIFLRDWHRAEEVLGELAAESPENAYVLYRLSRCYVARGDWQGAFDLAVKSLSIDPSSALVHEFLGHALMGMGMMEQARAAFGNATVLDPLWARPKAMLVAVARRLKRPQAEINSLRDSYLEAKKAGA